MKRFHADLHIHTALSPCAEEEMTPVAIIEEAVAKGLDMIAICDHNACGNSAAVQQAGMGKISVIAGMEITTAEDIHVLGLFPGADAARAAAEVVQATLPELKEGGSKFGRQLVIDAEDNIVATETRMLSASSTLNLSEIIRLIGNGGGLAIAAHVNRPSFSVIRQLGFFPKDAGFDGIEVFSPNLGTCNKYVSPDSISPDLVAKHSYGLPIFCSSDSHFLSDIGTCFTVIEMFEPTFAELNLAVKELNGRRVLHA